MAMLQNLVQRSLERFDVRIVPHDPIPDGAEATLLPLLIRGLFDADHAVTFCQVGANDCSSNDPLHSIIRPGWRGLLVEPQPHAFARVQAKFASNPNVVLKNCAVAPERRDMTLYSVKDVGGASDASFSQKHVLKFVGGDASRVVSRTVPAVPLMDLLAEADLLALDVLLIDVEGFDDHVVRMLDPARCRPAIIQYEHKHIPLRRERECVHWLIRNNYRLVRLPVDTIAIDPEATIRRP
jgi:FkbM family methyltransferase